MKIFKFGGASVKDANGVRNVLRVLDFTGHDNLILVISAMGKTTNALEEVLHKYFAKEDFENKIKEIQEYHIKIADDLMPQNTDFLNVIKLQFQELNSFLNKNKSPNYDFVYDQVVSHGELISTKIVNEYFNSQNINSLWVDARDYIKTDSTYREGIVDWEITCQNLNNLEKNQLYITQGFIGSNENYFTTTLGREGSDYTGAILAYCLHAESLTIWKDVPGVLNADPRFFDQTTQLFHISYEEAIELAYYGASVIHPKTLQPLQRKNIPLYVKSFEKPENEGTGIKKGQHLEPEVPCFIVKKNQVVFRISTKNFAFIDEQVIRDIFHKLSDYLLKVNLIQISAISLSLCVEDKFNTLQKALESFTPDFEIEITPNCALYTIRHAQKDSENSIQNAENALIRQAGKNTLQLVIQEEK